MEDAEGTLAKAGIHEGGAQPRLKRVRGFVCEVCYDDATKETLAMSCDHRCESLWLELSCSRAASSSFEVVILRSSSNADPFLVRPSRPPAVCKDCYSHYISSKVTDEGESRRIECMANDCNVIVDEKTVELLVPPDILSRCVLPL